MAKYRNVKTGVTVDIPGRAFGDWVPVEEPTPAPVPEAKPEQPKKRKATKKK